MINTLDIEIISYKIISLKAHKSFQFQELMEAAIKTLENQLKQKKENLKKLQDEISSLESVIQNLKPKTQTQNTETIILPESPPKSPVTKKPHKFYVIFNEPMK